MIQSNSRTTAFALVAVLAWFGFADAPAGAFASENDSNNPTGGTSAITPAPTPPTGGPSSNNLPGAPVPEQLGTPDAPIALSPVSLVPDYHTFPDSCQYATLGGFTAVGTVTFDTDALTYGGAPGGVALGNDAVFTFDSIDVPVGTTVRGVGSRRLMLLAEGAVTVAGTVHVDGSNATPTAPSCQPRTTSPGGAGGGAGFGGIGGAGGGGGAGSGGVAYGDLLSALEGGSGGGGASTNSGDGCQGASGGGGGGGLLLSSRTSVTIAASGVVSANGGNGALSDTGASGAGSGGGIVVRAPSVNHAGAVRANGGVGGGGGCCGGGGGAGGGRILVIGSASGAGTYSVAPGGTSSGNPGGAAGASGVAFSAPYGSPCLEGFCQIGTLGDFIATGTVVFDTDAGTYGGAPGGILFDGKVYFSFDHVTVPLGTTVRGIGSRPLVIAAADTMQIAGTVHVDGSNATPTAPSCQPRTISPGGAGGGAGGLGTVVNPGAGSPGSGPGGGGSPPPGTAGAGGAGFGGIGGAGGGGGAGSGGVAYGDLFTALAGGSGGGGASTNSGDGCQGASGGGGGGALMLAAGNSLTIDASGIVSANGGNGALSDTGASGAGGGGGIVLRAPTVSHAGLVRARGGVGGAGGCCGGGGGAGGGRILVRGALSGAGTLSVTNGGASSGNPGGAAGAVGVSSSDDELGFAVTKTDFATTEIPGTPVTYTIAVFNSTSQGELDVPVADTFAGILSGVTYTAVGTGGASGFTAAGSGAINDVVDLPAGSSVTYTVTGTISALATGTLTNRVCAGPDFALDIDGLTPQADVVITKSDGVATAVPGTTTTYTIVASNTGPSAAPAANVTDNFPAACTSVAWTCLGAGGGSCPANGSGNINATVGLPVGGSATFTASCSINPAATGTLVNTATVAPGAGVTDPTPGNNSATDIDSLTPQANVAITKSDGVATAVPGTNTTYTIVAGNAGPSAAPAANVTDNFPAACSSVAWTCVGAAGGSCPANGTGNLNATVGLPVGGSVTFTAVCAISSTATGTLVNTATVAPGAGVTDPTPGDNSASDTDTLTPQANVAITKSDGVTTAVPGTNTTYTIVASNAGPSAAPAANVADNFPAACSSVVWSCVGAGGGTCPANGTGNLNATVGLPVGGSATFDAVCSIDPTATGTLVNTTTVAPGAGVTDPTPGNNSATDTDTLTPQADVSILKSVDPTAANVGDLVTFTIVVANAGPSQANGVAVQDLFPAEFQWELAWTCVAQGGATCTPAGTGDIVDTVDLPPGSSVTYTATCEVYSGDDADVTNTATVSLPAGITDPNPGDESSSATVAINAFEVQEIPALGRSGLAILALLVGAAGWLALRRQA